MIVTISWRGNDNKQQCFDLKERHDKIKLLLLLLKKEQFLLFNSECYN